MIRLATAAMGTRFELALLDGACDLRAAGEAAIEEIEDWHRSLSRFAPDSLVSHISRTAADTPVRLDRETYALFEDALQVWRDSDGAFDVGRNGDCPHFASESGDSRPFCLDASALTISLASPAIGIDLGAIAKGHALDCAAAVLRSCGVTAALLHGGTSSVVAIGQPADGDGWPIALAPGNDIVVLRDGRALSVSDADSQVAAAGAIHIIDPRSGAPVAHARQVAVIGPSARLADAWSTALVVLDRVPPTFPAGYEARFFPGDPQT